MHMADALLSPAVGGALWVASGVTLAWSSRVVGKSDQDRLVPLMGILGAFVFAAQMINFTIPATGSSGHIGGGLLLSILLGPSAAFVVIASVLTVQALFFADGGLLALGANIFNLGVFPCFVGYVLVYRPLLPDRASSRKRQVMVTVLAAVVGLQLGALGVVLETQLSGLSSLPLKAFLLLMQPIHLAIGIVEGLATAAVILFVRQHRPDLLGTAGFPDAAGRSIKPVLLAFGVLAALTAGLFSSFASSQPDGLEWSIARVSGSPEIQSALTPTHVQLAEAQKKLAWLPDYRFPWIELQEKTSASEAAQLPAIDPATSLSGLIGGMVTFGLVLVVGFLMRRRRFP